MRTGRLRHQATLQRKSGTPDDDSTGEDIRDYANVLDGDGNPVLLNCGFSGLTAREAEQTQQQVQGIRTQAMLLRWSGANWAPRYEDRLVFEGRYLNIIEVSDFEERKREMRVIVAELVAGS